MQNNLIYFHSQNHTKTHNGIITDFSDKTVKAPLEGGKICGPLASGSKISVSGANCLKVPYKYTFTGFSELSKSLHGLKPGTEYVFYCDKIERGGTANPCLFIGNVTIESSPDHTFSPAVAIKFTVNFDAPQAFLYSNGYDYNQSVDVTTTVYGMRIYESRFDHNIYAPYAYAQTVSVAYELGENDKIEFGDRVILSKNGTLSDITTEKTGSALLALKSNYPITQVSGCEVLAKMIGGI